MSSDELWTGEDTGAETDDDHDPLKAGDSVAPSTSDDPAGIATTAARRVLSDLTYREAHAFTLGFAPMALGLLLLPMFAELGLGLIGAAVALSTASLVAPRTLAKNVRYIGKEAHYVLVGALSGFIAGSFGAATVTVAVNLWGLLA